MKSSFAAILFSACVGNLAVPVVTIFVPLLAYRLGAAPYEVGLAGGITYAMFALTPPLLGRLSDSLKARGVLVAVALAVIFPAYLLFDYALSPVQLILLRALEGVGWTIFWVTLDVLVSEEPTIESSKAYSIYNAAWSVVAAISPLVGTALVLILDIRSVFLIMAVVTGFAAIVAFFLLRGSGVPQRKVVPPTTEKRPSRAGSPTVTPGAGRAYEPWVYMIAIIVANSMRGIFFSFFAAFATTQGLSILTIGTVIFGFGIGRLGTYLLLMRDRFRALLLRRDRIRGNIVTALVAAIVAGLVPLLADRTGALDFVSFTAVGVCTSTMMALGQVELIAKASPGRRGHAAGLFESSTGIGTGAAPILAGIAAGRSLYLPFLYGPLGCLVALLVAFALIRRAGPSRLET